MIRMSLAQHSAPATLVHTVPSAQATQLGHEWTLRRAQPRDVVAIKSLFLQLHTFNATLDPRFALAPDWEGHFDAAMEEALQARDALCLVIAEEETGRIMGFVLAAVHRDSGMWQYRDWVEVEALYVSDEMRGQGCGAALLDSACEWAESVGQPVVQLYVTASNQHALTFYERQGFREAQAILRKVPAEPRSPTRNEAPTASPRTGASLFAPVATRHRDRGAPVAACVARARPS